jgi:hypothetical protein
MIALLLAVGVPAVSAAWHLLDSLAPSARAENEARAVIDLPTLEEGKLQVVMINERPLFFLRPNAEQRRAIDSLERQVAEPSRAAFKPELNAFVYWGESTRWGFPLREISAAEGRREQPDRQTPWLGGYWSERGEVSYDYAGRAITSQAYTYNGFNVPYPNLVSPRLLVQGNRAEVFRYGR